jgi:hypothetical protein
MADHTLIGLLIGLASGIAALIIVCVLTLRRYDVARVSETRREHRTLAEVRRSAERSERRLREDIATTRRELETATRDARDESALSARALRDEITGGLRGVTDEVTGGLQGVKEGLTGSLHSVRGELTGSLQDVKDELAGSLQGVRVEVTGGFRGMKDEVTVGLRGVTDTFVRGISELTHLHKAQTEILAERLGQLTEGALAALRDHPMPSLHHLAGTQERQLAALTAELRDLANVMDARLDQARSQLDEGLRQILADHREDLDQVRADSAGHAKDMRNELLESLRVQLEEIRSIVDHKLDSTLERRIEERFTVVSQRLQLVSERLEQVHQGLVEVQRFAAGIGNIQRALTNVKLGSPVRTERTAQPAAEEEAKPRTVRRRPRPVVVASEDSGAAAPEADALRAQQ